MKRNEFINKYALDVSLNKLERLNDIVTLENIDNNWSKEKYISLDVINNNCWKINFYDMDESIYFIKVDGSKYFKMLLSLEDIKASDTTGLNYIAHGTDGEKYEASYNANLKIMFFCIPEAVEVLGYSKAI